MTATAVQPSVQIAEPDVPAPSAMPSAFLHIAALATAAAGVIHVAASGAHGEHPATAVTFVVLAALQIGWAMAAFARPSRAVAGIGAVLGLAAFGGWVITKISGVSFIAGLEQSEAVQWSDATAAALAILAMAAATVAAVVPGDLKAGAARRSPAVGVLGIVIAIILVPTIVYAGSHQHATGDHDLATGGADDVTSAPLSAVPPKPYDPALPIDFGGVDGVSPAQQARAENLVAITLARLPRFADPAVAVAAGYRSIGDGFTGYEHFVLWGGIDDDHILNPDVPESLVYETKGSSKKLVAAMYMLRGTDTLDTVPDIGGRLTQWHIHNNLCYTQDPEQPLVRGVTNAAGECAAPLVKGREVPMIHVWITPHPCGPFAALEGVGAGQIKADEARWCDTAHGH